MTGRVDDILALIDAGLQSSPESDQYRDVAPSVGEGCVRCPAVEVPEGGELCEACRAFLLGDADTDPAATPVGSWGPTWSTDRVVHENIQAMWAAMTAPLPAGSMTAQFTPEVPPDRDWIGTTHDLAALHDRFARERQAAIIDHAARARRETLPDRDRFFSYWRARLLWAEHRGEPVYVTETELESLLESVPAEDRAPERGWRRVGEQVPEVVDRARLFGQPVIVDDNGSARARSNLGDPPRVYVRWPR